MTEALESLGEALEAREVLREATRTDRVRSLGRRTQSGRSRPGQGGCRARLKPMPHAGQAGARHGRRRSNRRADCDFAVGPGTESVAPVPCLAAAGRGDVEPRVAAIKALGLLETAAESTVPVLIAALAQRDLRLRTAAASGLVRFGPDARPALPELRKAVINHDLELRLAAAEAILAIERKPRLRDL